MDAEPNPDGNPFAFDELRLRPDSDEVTEAGGHPVLSFYVERYWLPTIGPTALFALRVLRRALGDDSGEVVVKHRELAAELGVSSNVLTRTLTRLARFGALRVQGSELRMRTHLPPLTPRQRLRLPAHLLAELGGTTVASATLPWNDVPVRRPSPGAPTHRERQRDRWADDVRDRRQGPVLR